MNVDANGQLFIPFDRPLVQLLTPDEIVDRADEELIRKMFEDKRFELKPNGFHPQDVGDYIAMWANTRPDGGIIVVGIRNDKIVEGCGGIHPKRLNELEKAGSVFAADAVYDVKRVAVHRDKDDAADFVLMYRVKYHRTRVVRIPKGKVFIRIGDEKRELKNSDEIRLLQEEKGEVHFERERCQSLRWPEHFDQSAISAFVDAVHRAKSWDDVHATEDVLSLAQLGEIVDDKFVPYIACALVFAIDPRREVPGARIRFLRFEGEAEGHGDRWNAVQDKIIDGTVPQQIKQIDALLRTQLRTFSKLGPDGKFYTSKEYPEFAWQEAIVNACVHRSYGNGLRNTPTFVKMFDDRLVIESPGPFPPFVNPANFTHVPRNPYLMDAMYYLDFVKMAHEGTRRMRSSMIDFKLPEPEWKQRDGKGDPEPERQHYTVVVTLRNDKKQRKVWVDSDVAHILGTRIASTLDEDEKRIVNFIAENDRINVTQAARVTGGRWATTKQLLVSLEDRGIVKRVKRPELIRDAQSFYTLNGPPVSTSTPIEVPAAAESSAPRRRRRRRSEKS
jgi:ATP-dependent DNA helicase RecG